MTKKTNKKTKAKKVLSSADDFFQAAKVEVIPIYVKKQNTEMFIKTLSVNARDKVSKQVKEEDSILKFRAAVMAATVCSENGELIFAIEDVEKILDSNGEIVIDITDEIFKHIGMVAEVKEEEVKNSEGTTQSDSGSNSV